MRLRPSLVRIGVGAVMAIGIGSAEAQTRPSEAPSPAPGDGQVTFERRPRLTAEEMLTQGEAHMARVQQGIGQVRKQLDAARGKKDVVRTLCVDDKRSQLDVTARAAGDRMNSLRGAVRIRDMGAAHHEFTMLSRQRENADRVVAEAGQCVGGDSVFVESSQREFKVDLEMLALDRIETSQLPNTDTTILVDVPQEASPKN